MSQSIEPATPQPRTGLAQTPVFQSPVFQSQGMAALGLLLIGTLVRVIGIADEPLWYDELYSATQASSPISEVVAAVRAFDMHPPLYYLQLSAWAKLGTSDAWLRLNSTLWWLLAGGSLYYVARQLTNFRTAILATALFVVNPTGFHFGQELRMYAMLMCFAVWSYYLTEKWFASPVTLQRILSVESGVPIASQGSARRIRWQAHLPILIVTTACIYSHGASFMILLGIWSHAAWMLVSRPTNRRAFLEFMAIQMIAVLLGLAEHVRAAAMHLSFEQGLSYASAPQLREWIQQTSWLFSGRSEPFGAWTIPLTVLVTGIPIALACCCEGPVRRAILFYAAAPILACLAVSHLSRPIWVFRAISFTVPFCCLGLAYGLQRIDRQPAVVPPMKQPVSSRCIAALRGLLVGLIIGGSCLGIKSQASFYPRPSYFADMSQELRRTTDAGDVIFVPQTYSYWALCWYFVQPGSVQPFTDTGEKRTKTGVAIVKADMKQGLPLADWPIVRPTVPDATTYAGSPELTHDVTRTSPGRTYLLTTGQAQADHLVAEVKRRHNLAPTRVTQHGTIVLWQLQP